jgi:hypothetical protein
MKSGPLRIDDKMQDPEFVAALPRSRAAAKALGVGMYLGALCPKEHNSYRLTKNGSCAKCASIVTSAAYKAWLKTPEGAASRAKTNAKWNATDKAQTAKDRWKAKNPKWAWVVSAVGGARTRAKYANLPFNISNEYVYSIAGDTCPALGVPLSYGGTGRPTPFSASIDKLVPELGYVEGNVVVISSRANAIKSNATTAEVASVLSWMQATLPAHKDCAYTPTKRIMSSSDPTAVSGTTPCKDE